MALVFAIMYLYNLKKKKKSIVSVRSFLISGIDKLEWSTIPACHSFMCSFNRGNIEGTNSENLCLMFKNICFVLCLQSDWFLD